VTTGVSCFNNLDLLIKSLKKHKAKVLVAEAWNNYPPLDTGLDIAAQPGRAGICVDYIHYGSSLLYVKFLKKRWILERQALWLSTSSAQERS
jgi:hypothetical protein